MDWLILILGFFAGCTAITLIFMLAIFLKKKDKSFEQKLLAQWEKGNDIDQQRNNALDFILEALERKTP